MAVTLPGNYHRPCGWCSLLQLLIAEGGFAHAWQDEAYAGVVEAVTGKLSSETEPQDDQSLLDAWADAFRGFPAARGLVVIDTWTNNFSATTDQGELWVVKFVHSSRADGVGHFATQPFVAHGGLGAAPEYIRTAVSTLRSKC